MSPAAAGGEDPHPCAPRSERGRERTLKNLRNRLGHRFLRAFGTHTQQKHQQLESQDGLETSRIETKPDVGQGGVASVARSRAVGAPRVAVGSGVGIGSVPAQQPRCLPKLEGGRSHLTRDFSRNRGGGRQEAMPTPGSLLRVCAEPGSVIPSVPRKCHCFLLHRCGRSPTVPWLCGVVSAGEKPQIPFSLEGAFFLFFRARPARRKRRCFPSTAITLRPDGYFCQSPTCRPRGGSPEV